MPIRLRRGLVSHIRKYRDGFALQVRCGADARSDLAAEALEVARQDLLATPAGKGPKFVSEVIASRDGPLLLIDASHVSNSSLDRIVQVMTERLEEVGLDDVVLGAPEEDPRFYRADGGPVVLLHLFTPRRGPFSPPERYPLEWIEQASEWALEGSTETDEVWMTSALAVPIGPQAVRPMLQRESERPGGAAVFVGHPWEKVRAVGLAPNDGMLALAAGGTSIQESTLLQVAEELKAYARSLVPQLAYAAVQIRNDFGDVWGMRLLERRFHDEEPGAAFERISRICDEVVFDVYPWQLLGPKHVTRLTGAGEAGHASRQALKPLRDDFAELEVTALSIGLSEPEHLAAMRERGRAQLANCLVNRDQVFAIEQEHR
jgi:hypothetical protein